MEPDDYTTPDLDEVPEDESAEPEDADIPHEFDDPEEEV